MTWSIWILLITLECRLTKWFETFSELKTILNFISQTLPTNLRTYSNSISILYFSSDFTLEIILFLSPSSFYLVVNLWQVKFEINLFYMFLLTYFTYLIWIHFKYEVNLFIFNHDLVKTKEFCYKICILSNKTIPFLTTFNYGKNIKFNY